MVQCLKHMSKHITIVVPVFNEAENILSLYERIAAVFSELGENYQYRLLFVDDGSTDASVERIDGLMKANSRVHCVRLSRNFGKEAALSAGIAQAEGDAVILIDADLQHPPALIKDFIAQWELGADIVIGLRKKNPDEGLIRKVGSKVFAYIMRKIGDAPTISGATDFRLLDSIVVEEFKHFTEHGRMTRGLIDWLGFTRAYVSFDAHKRHAGEARYGYRKLMGLGFSALFSHSMLPLKVAGYLGFFITLFAGGLGLFIFVEQIILGDPFVLEIPATAMLAVMILFLNGILLVSIGLVSVYVAKIHHETLNRPLFVIRQKKSRTIPPANK